MKESCFAIDSKIFRFKKKISEDFEWPIDFTDYM